MGVMRDSLVVEPASRFASQPVWEAKQASAIQLCLPNVLFDLFGSSFCGVSIAQHWADLVLWELFLRRHPEIEMIIEIGTGCGGMSLFLLAQCVQRNIRFVTFDVATHVQLAAPLAQALGLSKCFVNGDVFEDARGFLEDLLRTDVSKTLFCDGGDKPREFRTFVPLLRDGDYVAVHDCGTEFSDDDAQQITVSVRSILVDENVPSLTRFWQMAR